LNGDTIGNFAAAGNIIDLTNVTWFGQAPTFHENAAGTSGTLSISDGSHNASITLAGNLSASGFSTSSDGVAGTDIIYHMLAT